MQQVGSRTNFAMLHSHAHNTLFHQHHLTFYTPIKNTIQLLHIRYLCLNKYYVSMLHTMLMYFLFDGWKQLIQTKP